MIIEPVVTPASSDLFVSTGHQIMEMGIVFSMFLVAVLVLGYVIKKQYTDSRSDRADLLTAYSKVGDAMNNLAKQQEISNAQKNPCQFKP